MEFCCDYMANFSPGWNSVTITRRISARAPNLKLCGKSEQKIKMASRMRLVKRSALILSQFSVLISLNFQLFGMVATYKMMEHKRNFFLAAYLSARKSYLQKKRRHLQARRMQLLDELLTHIPIAHE